MLTYLPGLLYNRQLMTLTRSYSVRWLLKKLEEREQNPHSGGTGFEGFSEP